MDTAPINKKEAIRLAKSKFWEEMGALDIARFQLATELLCMPFNVFHEAVEEALGRPVWSHEFAYPERLFEELDGDSPLPRMDEIIALIPTEKLIVIGRSLGDRP